MKSEKKIKKLSMKVIEIKDEFVCPPKITAFYESSQSSHLDDPPEWAFCYYTIKSLLSIQRFLKIHGKSKHYTCMQNL